LKFEVLWNNMYSLVYTQYVVAYAKYICKILIFIASKTEKNINLNKL
jgi:hypothetical protein